MITEEEQEKSAIERIRILRETYGDDEPEVKAWDEAHPAALDEAEAEPEAPVEVPAGKIGGKKSTPNPSVLDGEA
jgi:hypothetical protein